MSQVLTLEFDTTDPDWVGAKFAHNERFLSFLKFGVKPESYRRWVPAKKRWEVHRQRLLMIVSMGKRFFNHVDYSSLPEGLQILIVKFLKEREGDFVAAAGMERDPFQTLHLLPTAPWEVIQAAYKALAFLYHPDRGGDQDQFRCVDEAYHQLKRARESRVVSNG